MIDLNSRSQAGERVNWHIDQALVEERRSQEPRDYLGCSYLGDACERAVQYAYTGASRDEPTAQLLRRFQRGHIMEDQAADWLRKADASGGRGNTVPPNPQNGVQGTVSPAGFRAAPGDQEASDDA